MYKATGERMIVTSGFVARTISRALAYGLRETRDKTPANVPITHTKDGRRLPPTYEEARFMERVTRYGELAIGAEEATQAVRNLRAISDKGIVFRGIQPEQAAFLLNTYDHSDPDAEPAGPFRLNAEELAGRLATYYPELSWPDGEASVEPPAGGEHEIRIHDARAHAT